jgi:hemerythrin-like metal-binding protein
MDKINNSSQENAKTTEQSAASIVGLVSVAEDLEEMIDEFKINKTVKKVDTDVLFKWGPKYMVDIDFVDKQHKRLVDLINELYKAMTEGKGNNTLAKILEELVDYTEFHFGDEEKMLEKHNYPDIKRHKEIHKNLVAKINNIKDEFKTGESSLSVGVLTFLKDWLINHIGKIDMKYSKYLHDKKIY